MYVTYTAPRPPRELQLLSYLQFRLHLSTTNKAIYQNLSKGFAGEQRLSEMLDQNLTSRYIKLSDLHFVNAYHTEFQMDSLLLLHNKIILLEVKNYEGDFYIHKDSWHIAENHKEIRDPSQQLKRSHLLFEELLQRLGYDTILKSYLVFVNSCFTLYHAPIDRSIILPTQLNRFVDSLNKEKGHLTNSHRKLANQLITLHTKTPQTTRLFPYEYEQLNKGIPCVYCGHFYFPTSTQLFKCQKCGHSEAVDKAIIRCTLEFSLLFPDTKITTPIMYNWCGEIISRKRIRHILKKHFQVNGTRKDAYYTMK